MITNIFYSNQNKNAIKAVLNENIGVNTGNKYDIMIQETMDGNKLEHIYKMGIQTLLAILLAFKITHFRDYSLSRLLASEITRFRD
jgi:hypothetical protein